MPRGACPTVCAGRSSCDGGPRLQTSVSVARRTNRRSRWQHGVPCSRYRGDRGVCSRCRVSCSCYGLSVSRGPAALRRPIVHERVDRGEAQHTTLAGPARVVCLCGQWRRAASAGAVRLRRTPVSAKAIDVPIWRCNASTCTCCSACWQRHALLDLVCGSGPR